MPERFLISVVTPFRNVDDFLAEAIESVLVQTCNDWELLLVDDGSIDGSGDIARRFAQAYPQKIRYLRHPDDAHRGVSSSRNLALRVAAGRYITFLDADDVYTSHKLEE